ncbi:MAG: hypothetical protein ACUVUR_06115 [bacterium]
MSLTLCLLLLAGSFDLYGQASANLIAGGYQGKLAGSAGIEYRPGLELNKTIPTGRFNLVASLTAGFSINLPDDGVKKKLLIDPYRLFLGYGAERYEIRAGLQQINFGSAVLLRPLRWFDRIDPRDPLQTTEGVYGLLARGYSGNNNLWLWGLLGNREPKGYEITPTPQWKPEAGGRVEVALPRGELAAAFHHRLTEATLPAGYDTIAENRIGLDGRWDIGIGLWFEGLVGYPSGQQLAKTGGYRNGLHLWGWQRFDAVDRTTNPAVQ